MIRRAQSWWIFAGCATVVAVALFWLSASVLRLERGRAEAQAENEHQQRTHRALWRMDSWLSLFVAREAARPYTEYFPADSSPLRSFESDYLKLHFHVDAQGTATSPKTEVEAERWQTLRPQLGAEAIALALAPSERHTIDPPGNLDGLDGLDGLEIPAAEPQPSPLLPEAQAEFHARVQCAVPAPPGQAETGGVPVDVGPLTPVWLPPEELAFIRRVTVEGQVLYQGFLADWPALSARLQHEIRDLFPQAKLQPLAQTPTDDPYGRYLANVPAALMASSPRPDAPALFGPTRMTLALAWLTTLIAALMVGSTLHKSLQLGERRRRFVSAVTHELRTPLTTFRMYSEMLADGVVQDEQQRREYLQTLKEESARLATMVENVLTHSRLEERQAGARMEQMTARALLDRLIPSLARQAEASGMKLRTAGEIDSDVPLNVDVEVVGQVLRNLVDNATKYARNGTDAPLELVTRVEGDRLQVELRDHGPGVPTEQARAIFKPFDRGGRDPADPAPGIGLGLALSRGLARDLGGELTLEPSGSGGARFRLSLPLA